MATLESLKLFIRVVETGSFSTAAKEGGVSQSSVSKQIASLESWLGVQLLKRSSRDITVTSPGKLFYEKALFLTQEIEKTKGEVASVISESATRLRISVAPAFSSLYITPYLSSFYEQHPGIHIELLVSERRLDFIKDDIDIAVRHGDIYDAPLIQRKLAISTFFTVASPAYLAKHPAPDVPDDLYHHQCLLFSGGTKVYPWEYRDETGMRLVVNPSGKFKSNDAEQLLTASLSGLGVAYLPCWLTRQQLAAGHLVRLLEGFGTWNEELSAVFSKKNHKIASIRIFNDFLEEKLTDSGLSSQLLLSEPFPISRVRLRRKSMPH